MRILDLLSEEKAAVPPKPRNFVAKNAKMGGAGQHKDKKKAEKQGDVKHKKDLATMESQGVAEGLGKTIKRGMAGWGAFDKDKPADVVKRVKGQDTDTLKGLSNRGSTGKGSPAELQQKAISRELKKRGEQGVAEDADDKFSVADKVEQLVDQHRLYDKRGWTDLFAKLAGRKLEVAEIRREMEYASKFLQLLDSIRMRSDYRGQQDPRKDQELIDLSNQWLDLFNKATTEFKGMSGQGVAEAVEDRTSYQVAKVLHDHGIKYDSTREDELIKVIGLALVKELNMSPKMARGVMNDEDFLGDTFGELRHMEEGVSERVRDPEDWDEGNTEPGNNFAVYINGKKWKVFPGPAGAYADSPEERRELGRLQAMAQRKSQETGKKWEVYVTGEPATR